MMREPLGIIATVRERLPKARFLVESDFVEERDGFLGGNAHHFDASIPEEVEDEEDWDLLYNGLRDGAGTLQAIVTGRSLLAAWTPDLLERWDAEWKARQARNHREYLERRRRVMEERAPSVATSMAENILRDANREPDETWHPFG